MTDNTFACIYIAPHEVAEATEAYFDRLTDGQREQIHELAEEGKNIMLLLDFHGKCTKVVSE